MGTKSEIGRIVTAIFLPLLNPSFTTGMGWREHGAGLKSTRTTVAMRQASELATRLDYSMLQSSSLLLQVYLLWWVCCLCSAKMQGRRHNS